MTAPPWGILPITQITLLSSYGKINHLMEREEGGGRVRVRVPTYCYSYYQYYYQYCDDGMTSCTVHHPPIAPAYYYYYCYCYHYYYYYYYYYYYHHHHSPHRTLDQMVH